MITTAKAHENPTVSTSAIHLDSTKRTQVDTIYCQIQVQTARIRVTIDGTTPVAGSVGKLWNVGDIFEVWGQKDMNNFQAVREDSTDAVIDVDYYGQK